MLIATTGYTYTREQAYNDVRVRSGEQLVRLNVRNEVRLLAGCRPLNKGRDGVSLPSKPYQSATQPLGVLATPASRRLPCRTSTQCWRLSDRTQAT